MDFLPAIHSKHHRFPNVEMGPDDVNGPSVSGGPVYAETGSDRSYASNQPMQETGRSMYTVNGANARPMETNVPPSRNF